MGIYKSDCGDNCYEKNVVDRNMFYNFGNRDRTSTIYMKNINKKESVVCEPANQYVPVSVNPDTINVEDQGISPELRKRGYMTVTEYFDKVKKALDLKYEKLQSNN